VAIVIKPARLNVLIMEIKPPFIIAHFDPCHFRLKRSAISPNDKQPTGRCFPSSREPPSAAANWPFGSLASSGSRLIERVSFICGSSGSPLTPAASSPAAA
jgi:hypothetical protein